MNTNRENKATGEIKDKTLALFFTIRVSLKTWFDIGMIQREVAIYNELSKYFKRIYFFTYGSEDDLEFKSYLADNIIVIPKKYISNNLLYSLLIPLIHRKILRYVNVLKTNQMGGSWSAVLTKLLYRKKLVVRTGYMLSLTVVRQNPNSRRKWMSRLIEKVAYKIADAIITSSKANFKYVEKNYHPSVVHAFIPNYVETSVFKPLQAVEKKKGSICFIGRLSREKNLLALLKALQGLPYTLTIIGSGGQKEQLEEVARNGGANVNFLGNIPNHELPQILNQHQVFILPSLWEGMPKALLEAMACGLPVIGTNVDGINEVIEHGENGILCRTDPKSIKEAIVTLMENEDLKQSLGESARRTIVNTYGFPRLVEKELKLMEGLV